MEGNGLRWSWVPFILVLLTCAGWAEAPLPADVPSRDSASSPTEPASDPERERLNGLVQDLASLGRYRPAEAVKGLIAARDPRCLALLVPLLRGQEPSVRGRAARVLGEVGSLEPQGVLAALSEAREAERDPPARSEMELALATLQGRGQEVERLRRIAEGFFAEEVESANQAEFDLIRLADPLAGDIVITCLADRDERVRQRAAKALGKLWMNDKPKVEAALEWAKVGEVEPAVLAELRDSLNALRAGRVSGVSRTTTSEGRRGPGADYLTLASKACISFGPNPPSYPRTVSMPTDAGQRLPDLLKTLGRNGVEEGKAAAQTLRDWRLPGLVPQLEEVLPDGPPEVMVVVAEILLVRKSLPSFWGMMERLLDGDAEIRRTTARELGDLGLRREKAPLSVGPRREDTRPLSSTARKNLFRLMDEERNLFRGYLRETHRRPECERPFALGGFGFDVSTLVKVSEEDPEPSVQAEAKDALRRIDSLPPQPDRARELMETALDLLEDPDHAVQKIGAQHLVWLQCFPTLSEWMTSTKDSTRTASWPVRSEDVPHDMILSPFTAYASPARIYLLRALKSSDDRVRQEAIRILSARGPEDFP